MRMIDADVLKENYKNKIKSNLIDTRRGIDFSRYADTECKNFNKFIDEQPTVDVFNKIRIEIDKQYKWLLKAGCDVYKIDIAFGAIKAVLRNEVSE